MIRWQTGRDEVNAVRVILYNPPSNAGRGRGEVVFAELLDAIGRGDAVASVPGVAYRRDDGAIVSNPLAPIPHPNRLPEFAYHRIDLSRYIRSTFLGRRTIPHHSSYG